VCARGLQVKCIQTFKLLTALCGQKTILHYTSYSLQVQAHVLDSYKYPGLTFYPVSHTAYNVGLYCYLCTPLLSAAFHVTQATAYMYVRTIAIHHVFSMHSYYLRLIVGL